MSSMLDFGLGGSPGGPPDQIQIPGQDQPAQPTDTGTDTATYLRDAISSLLQFQQEDPDEEDKAQAAKALQIVQALLAVQQKQQDEALNLTGPMKQARKSGIGA